MSGKVEAFSLLTYFLMAMYSTKTVKCSQNRRRSKKVVGAEPVGCLGYGCCWQCWCFGPATQSNAFEIGGGKQRSFDTKSRKNTVGEEKTLYDVAKWCPLAGDTPHFKLSAVSHSKCMVCDPGIYVGLPMPIC